MAEMHVLQEQKQAQLRAVQAFFLHSDQLGHGNADNGPSMALSARSASLQRRTGSLLFYSGGLQGALIIPPSGFSERTLLFEIISSAAGINRASGPAAMSDGFYDLAGMDARQAYVAMDGQYTRGQ
ncbi:MAG: hypothetical protein LRY72_12925 [Saccharospirillaceae bacterium]|nr:hypothetical protein [Saccharospirillaceae bacterium]